jgi:hypothetical protein
VSRVMCQQGKRDKGLSRNERSAECVWSPWLVQGVCVLYGQGASGVHRMSEVSV